MVLLSSQGVGTGDHPSVLEDAVRASSGLEWTMLRPGAFHSNALQWAGLVRTRREAAAPFGDPALPTVHPADIAEVAAAAPRAPGHAGQVYDLTGPAPVSPRQQTAAIEAARRRLSGHDHRDVRAVRRPAIARHGLGADTVCLTASGLAGVGRFLVLRLFVFAERNGRTERTERNQRNEPNPRKSAEAATGHEQLAPA